MKECKWFFYAGERIPEPIQPNEIRVSIKNNDVYVDTCSTWHDEEILQRPFRLHDFDLIYKNLKPYQSTLESCVINEDYIFKLCSIIENCYKDKNLIYNDYEVTYFFFED